MDESELRECLEMFIPRGVGRSLHRRVRTMDQALTQIGVDLPEIARRVVSLFLTFRPPQRATSNLTTHDVQVLKLLMDGHSYRSAADELDVTIHAISFHLRSIYETLQVHSKAAVAQARPVC